MELKVHYELKPSDLWQVRMYYAYASYLAVVNLTCIVASAALIIAAWGNAPGWFRAVMLLFLSLFTVIQPLYLYLHSRHQLKKENPGALTLTFSDAGLLIENQGKTEMHPWKDILGVSKKPTLIILYTDEQHGYILTNRVLGKMRKQLLELIGEKRGVKRRQEGGKEGALPEGAKGKGKAEKAS